MATYYIRADVHSNNTELAIEKRGRIVARYSVPASIPSISAVLNSIRGKKILAMEEGPMAGWLYRNLHEKVDKLVVSEPRRNNKLAVLLRGNYLKAVHHTCDSQRAHLKDWVNLYHDRVRDAVRDINKIRACCRMHGVRIPRKVVRNPDRRRAWLSELDNFVLKAQLRMLWIGYDATKEQVKIAKKQFSSYARKYPIIKSWSALPGIGIIRAATIFAYLDTPWRFKNRAKLHRYCGVGLVRITIGKDKKGRPISPRLKLPWAVNRQLKNAVMGAATTAIERGDNAIKDYYQRMVSNGITPANARHSVARKLVSTMSAMWKTGNQYDEILV